MTVTSDQRFTRQRPCPICGGFDQAPRGRRQRCFGFLSDDGLWAHCTRTEYAGLLPMDDASRTYAHRLVSDCRCGKRHEQGPQPGANGDRPKRRKPKATTTQYEVRNLEGRLVAVHVRKDGPDRKSMWWERPDGSKGLGGMPVSSLPLYGAETLPALADSAEVVVTEGEKAADAIRSLGITALGTVTGAASTPGNDALGPLVRLAPVLWADNDDTGRQHMARIAARLTALGCPNVRLVDWPKAPPKGDAANAVDQDVDVRRLVAEARPWQPDTTDLAALLNDVAAFIRRYVVLSEYQAQTAAMWVAHTHSVEAAECTPYLSITSAEKRSGKTLLLEVLSLLVARPWFTGRVTAAVLVRKVARDAATLLLDESDAAFKAEKEYAEALRGILNSGYRRGGVASLCVKAGGDFGLRDFPVFGPKALAGIGKLPDTVADRSIPIELRRKARGENVERFRLRDAKVEAAPLRERLESWAALAVPVLEGARPDIPQELDDRAADVWEPLLAIADIAGGDWPERARAAAKALSVGEGREDDSFGVRLLRDIREVFERRKADRLPSAALVEALVKLEEAPWGDLWGKPLDARRLAKMLKPYGIGSKQLRVDPRTTMKGYQAHDFEDTWSRYISPGRETSETRETTAAGVSGDSGQGVSDNDVVTETSPLLEATFSGQDEANVSDVSLVSALRGVQGIKDVQEPGKWEADL